MLDDLFDLVLPAGHRLAERASIDARDLAGEGWPDFGPASPSFRLLARVCANASRPRIMYRINGCQTQALVAADEGIALLPRLMLEPRHPGVAIRPLKADTPIRRISALRLPSRHLTAPCARFLELLSATRTEHEAPARRRHRADSGGHAAGHRVLGDRRPSAGGVTGRHRVQGSVASGVVVLVLEEENHE